MSKSPDAVKASDAKWAQSHQGRQIAKRKPAAPPQDKTAAILCPDVLQERDQARAQVADLLNVLLGIATRMSNLDDDSRTEAETLVWREANAAIARAEKA